MKYFEIGLLVLMVACIAGAVTMVARSQTPQSARVVSEKHPGDGWTLSVLVATDRSTCEVYRADAYAAEVGKPFRCRWEDHP